MKKNNHQLGFMALLTVLIIASVLLIWSRAAVLSGLNQLGLAVVADRGAMARTLAEGCLEEALFRLRLDGTYGTTPVPPLTLPTGSCIITITNVTGGKQIEAISTLGEYGRRLRARAIVGSGVVSLDSYAEEN